MADRPLPTVIGPTENALRSLLTRVLASTTIEGYEEWVALNYASRDDETILPRTAAALKVDVDAAARTIAQLTIKGLLAERGLTRTGEAELLRARSAVAAVTATLVAGIGDYDQQIARKVLDTIRERAEGALAST